MNTDLTAMTTIAQAATARMQDQLLVDKGRCADVLLDLYGATDDIGLRWSISQRLDEIRFQSVVDAAEFRADLEAILAIAAGSEFAVPASAIDVIEVAEVTEVALPVAA